MIEIADVNLVTLSLQEQTDLLVRLLEAHPTGHLKASDGRIFVGLRSDNDVPSGLKTICSRRSLTAIYAPSLFILEPTYSRIASEEVTAHFRFFRSRVKSRTLTTTWRVVTVPRAAWNVFGIFCGSDNAFPNAPNAHDGLSGDAFGPDAPRIILPDLPPGIDVTVQLSNNFSCAVPFRAVLVGQREPQPKEDDVRLTKDEAARLAERLFPQQSAPPEGAWPQAPFDPRIAAKLRGL